MEAEGGGIVVLVPHPHLEPQSVYRLRGKVLYDIFQPVHDAALDPAALLEARSHRGQGQASAHAFLTLGVHRHHGVTAGIPAVPRVRVGKSREMLAVELDLAFLRTQVDVIACKVCSRVSPGDHRRSGVLLHHLEGRYRQKIEVEVEGVGGLALIARLVNRGHHVAVIRRRRLGIDDQGLVDAFGKSTETFHRGDLQHRGPVNRVGDRLGKGRGLPLGLDALGDQGEHKVLRRPGRCGIRDHAHTVAHAAQGLLVIVFPDARHRVGVNPFLHGLVHKPRCSQGIPVKGKVLLTRPLAKKLVPCSVFHLLPRKLDPSSGQSLPCQALGRCQGRELSLVDLEKVEAEDTGRGIVEIIHPLVLEAQGLGPCLTSIRRQGEDPLPGLGLPAPGPHLGKTLNR